MPSYPNRKYSGITNAQKTLIHTAKAKLGMDEETYRSMLQNVTISGVRSTLEMTPADADAVIKHLESVGFVKAHGRHEFTGYLTRLKKWQAQGRRPGMASAAQLARIETDWELMRWYWAPKGFANMEIALRAFLGKVAGVNDLRFLSSAKAVQVITAMKHTEAARRDQ